MDEKQLTDDLDDILSGYGIKTTATQRSLLARHLLLVIERNKTVNLTRISDPHGGAILHVLDSLLLVHAVGKAPEGAFVDVGTGAGFPGIPLGVVTGRNGLLVDAVGKKVHAVSDFIEDLHLDSLLEARHIRVEDLAREEPSRFSVVVARAVAQTNVLVEYAAPLLAAHGRLVLAKGNIAQEELLAGDRAAEVCGLRRVSRETYELPEGMGHREVISYERIEKPHLKLPRKAGMAKRQPLGL